MTLADAVWLAAAVATLTGLLDGAVRALRVTRPVLAGALLAMAVLGDHAIRIAGLPVALGGMAAPAAGGGLLLGLSGAAGRDRWRLVMATAAAVLAVTALTGGWPPPAVGALPVTAAALVWGDGGRASAGAALAATALAPLLPLWAHGLAPPPWPLGSGPQEDAVAVVAGALLAGMAALPAPRPSQPVPSREGIT